MSEAKRLAAEKAIEYVEDGMIVGVGTGFAFLAIGHAIAVIVGRGMARDAAGPQGPRVG